MTERGGLLTDCLNVYGIRGVITKYRIKKFIYIRKAEFSERFISLSLMLSSVSSFGESTLYVAAAMHSISSVSERCVMRVITYICDYVTVLSFNLLIEQGNYLENESLHVQNVEVHQK